MTDPRSPRLARTGLPDPSTIVSEALLRPPRLVLLAAADDADAAARPVITYRILRTNQVDPYDRPLAEAAIAFAARAAGDEFRGTARKAAKIAIANAETEVFTDLADLIASLPADAVMIQRDPPIQTGARSRRVREEKRNVRVRTFLYAASAEDDNDYHLIVGRAVTEPPMYMTMELSGTPPVNSRHFSRLKAARDAFKAFFAANPLGLPGASYDFYDPPIELDVEGSLFFDKSHAVGGRPGPQDLRPDMPVIWEVHPISRIVLEP